MPAVNGTGVFNLGRDCQIVLVGPFGQVNIPNVTMFNCKQETAQVKIDRLDGVQMNTELPKGWSFTIEAERANSALDDLFAQIEAGWFSSGTVAVSTLYQYITEASGTSSTYQIDDVSLKFDDPGDWKGDASVKQRLTGMGNRRRRV